MLNWLQRSLGWRTMSLDRHNQHTGIYQNLSQIQNKSWLRFGFPLSVLLLSFFPLSAIAQSNSERLPPLPLPPRPQRPTEPSVTVPPLTLPSIRVPPTRIPEPVRVPELPAPTPSQPPPQSNQQPLYIVYVTDPTTRRLQQVQRIEPQAFVRQYGNREVIQAGVFRDEVNAQRRVQELAQQGVQGAIARQDGNDNIGSDDLPDTRNARFYYVIIPGSPTQLRNIEQQIIRLGTRSQEIFQRQNPFGPHIAIGPFRQRQDAENRSRSLRNSGLDARVYYGR